MTPLIQKRARFRSPFQDLPYDVLPSILSQLTDRRDWHACALVNKAFGRIATPLLYRTLDSRIISKVGLIYIKYAFAGVLILPDSTSSIVNPP